MYDFVDRPLASLDRGGRFMVWAMRSWVVALGQRQCPAAAIGPAFARWGIIAALPRFHIAMSLLNRHGLMSFGFAPLACCCVSEDEAVLLATVRAVRDGPASTIHSLVKALVEEDSVAPFLDALTGLVAGLATSGLVPEASLPRE